ncbi:hypothetical protein JCM15765_34490 [Paradesulfitobacterium aromaticivorans]
MLVEIKFYGGMESFIEGISTNSGKIIQVEVVEGFTVRMVLNKLGISEEGIFFLLNDVFEDYDTCLANGDRISLFPAIFGG